MASRASTDGQARPDAGETLLVIREFPQCGAVRIPARAHAHALDASATVLQPPC